MYTTNGMKCQGDSTPVKNVTDRKLHLVFSDCIDDVQNEIGKLRKFVEEVEGIINENKSLQSPEIVDQSLSDFLNAGPDRMAVMRENLASLVIRLRRALFEPTEHADR